MEKLIHFPSLDDIKILTSPLIFIINNSNAHPSASATPAESSSKRSALLTCLIHSHWNAVGGEGGSFQSKAFYNLFDKLKLK